MRPHRVDMSKVLAVAPGGVYLLLQLLLFMGWTATSPAHSVPLMTPPVKSSSCPSTTQCFVALLGAPQTDAEWLIAYVAALHEHCVGVLEQRGEKGCKGTTRCMYVTPDGNIEGNADDDLDSSAGSQLSSSTLRLVDASFVPPPAANVTSIGKNSSSNSSMIAYWRAVAVSLQLPQAACLPITTHLDANRYAVCPRQRNSSHPHSADSPASKLQQLCVSNPKACFTPNANRTADMVAWWTGQAVQHTLQPGSTWVDRAKLQLAARTCTNTWGANGNQVTTQCATRGHGRTPWIDSLAINRMVVAIMDAYESSACNNTVSLSQAMAVQSIAQDLCGQGLCQGAASRSTLLSNMLLVTLLLAGVVACFLWQ